MCTRACLSPSVEVYQKQAIEAGSGLGSIIYAGAAELGEGNQPFSMQKGMPMQEKKKGPSLPYGKCLNAADIHEKRTRNTEYMDKTVDI
jgi:hypothetical protein